MFGLFLLSLIITVVGSQNCPSSLVISPSSTLVSMCSGLASSGRRVYVSGFGAGEGDHTCQCSLTLISSPFSYSGIIITDYNNGTSNSCDYSLVLVRHNQPDTTIYSCSQGVQIDRLFSMSPGEEVKLKLRNETSNNAGFQFCLQFETYTDFLMKVNCNKSVTTPTTKPSTIHSTTARVPSSSLSTTTTTTTKPSTIHSTTARVPSLLSTTTTTTTPSKPTTAKQKQNLQKDREPEVDIVPWVLFGVLLTFNLALLIFFVTWRFVRQRKERPTEIDTGGNYGNQTSSPHNHNNPHHVYYTNLPNNRVEGHQPSNGNRGNDLDIQYDSLQASELSATPYYTSLKLKEQLDYVNQK